MVLSGLLIVLFFSLVRWELCSITFICFLFNMESFFIFLRFFFWSRWSDGRFHFPDLNHTICYTYYYYYKRDLRRRLKEYIITRWTLKKT